MAPPPRRKGLRVRIRSKTRKRSRRKRVKTVSDNDDKGTFKDRSTSAVFELFCHMIKQIGLLVHAFSGRGRSCCSGTEAFQKDS